MRIRYVMQCWLLTTQFVVVLLKAMARAEEGERKLTFFEKNLECSYYIIRDNGHNTITSELNCIFISIMTMSYIYLSTLSTSVGINFRCIALSTILEKAFNHQPQPHQVPLNA